jgi:thermitase
MHSYKKCRILIQNVLLIALMPALCGASAWPPDHAPSFRNWGLYNNYTRQHIRAPEAWTLSDGDKRVVVAVIDTGLDASHPDIKNNLWHNKKDGIWGWDCITNTANPVDDHSHGTHIAGIIGASMNLSTGTSGVAHHVSIMPVKYYSDSATGAENLRHSTEALKWAIKHGAKIINYSGGGPEYSAAEHEVLLLAKKNGILVVAAAGNEKQNIDIEGNQYYPCSYKLDNIICVSGINVHGDLVPSSNWGKKQVGLVAPGENILSTTPGARYSYMSGTSQATAFVSGVAVLLLSKYPDLRPRELIDILIKSADKVPSMSERVASGGKVDAYYALALASRRRARRLAKELSQ